MQAKPKLKASIVIPVYGQWDLVKRNIDSLTLLDREQIAEIILVNDCSKDANPYVFDNALIKVINNRRNVGYTGTVNNGLKNANSEVIVLLDSDAYLIKPILSQLIDCFRNDESVGCIAINTVDENGNPTGSGQYDPTVIGLILGQRLEAKLERMAFRSKALLLPYSCSVSFRKKCLEELNFFDEKTFPVLEADNDLSMRIHKSKWSLLFTKGVVVCHIGGNSYKINSDRVRLFYESRWKLLKKHQKMRFPIFVRSGIMLRVYLEILIISMLGSLRPNSLETKEKLKGRVLLLKDVINYN